MAAFVANVANVQAGVNEVGRAQGFGSQHGQQRQHGSGSDRPLSYHRPGELIAPVVPATPSSAAAHDDANDGLIGPKEDAHNFTFRQRLYLWVEDPESSLAARIFSHFILYTIVASIACFVLETLPSLRDEYTFKVVEPVTTIVFTAEYLVRFFVCDAFPPECYGYQSKCAFVTNPLNVLDLLAILPFYLETAASELMSSAKPLRVLRSVRLIRCFRIFKLSKYSLGMTIMVESVLNSVQPLSILTFFLCIGVVLTSSLMYYAERTGCPDVKAKIAAGTFEAYMKACIDLDTGWSALERGKAELCCNEHGSAMDFQSIAKSFWWSVVTMTTVGYGDHVPRTLLGRLVGCLAMISGIVLISLPVAIVGSKFQLAYESLEEEKKSILNLDESEREVLLQGDPNMKGPASSAIMQQADLLASVVQVEKEKEKEEAQKSKQIAHPDLGAPSSGMSLLPGMSLPGCLAQGNRPPGASQFEPLRERFRSMEGMDRLSEKAHDEMRLLGELFDHIDRVEKLLKTSREKDAALDSAIRTEWASLSRAYDVNMRTTEASRTSSRQSQ